MAITVIYVYPHSAIMEWFVNKKTVHNTNVKYKKKTNRTQQTVIIRNFTCHFQEKEILYTVL